MDYFVAVEPVYQYFWQIELLIESFKMLNMQDKLLVAIVGTPELLPTNLLNHPRKIFCSDCNKTLGCNYPPINKIACLKAAIKHLGSSFTTLHTDMIIIGPVAEIEKNISFHPYPPNQEVFEMLKLPPDFTWISFDGATIFNQVPEEFFDNVLSTAKALIDAYGANWPVNFAALNLMTHQHKLSLLRNNLESPLTSTSDVLPPIIHYKTGLPPHFSKHIHITGEPYATLVALNPNFCTNYLRSVILSYKMA